MSQVPRTRTSNQLPEYSVEWTRSSASAVALTAACGFLGIVLVSPRVLPVTVLDAVSAIVVLLPPIAFGLGLLNRFGPASLPMRWKFVAGSALGLGATSILVLIGGLLGLLHRPLWLGVAVIQMLVGLWGIRQVQRTATQKRYFSRWRFLWMLSAPFFTLALLSASNVPGLIWQEEGNGYDVLEYHLQLPREYFEQGQVRYATHNVYSALPANMEMLYLLAMIVHRDAVNVGTTANMIHLIFGMLAIVAAWAIGSDFSPRAGMVGGVLLACCTWLEYLSGLAYVENGLLFYGLCSVGLLIRSKGESPAALNSATAGLTAGFAAGCKYTAVPMLALPCALICLCTTSPMSRRIRSISIFSVFAFTAFAPWLAKNWVSTGNPVFPLVNEWWKAQPEGWSANQTESWNRAHSVPGRAIDRVKSFCTRVPGDHEQRFGPAILGLGLIGLVGRRRDRVDSILLGMIVFQLLVWLLATHLYARFAIPLLIPLVILAAQALADDNSRLRSALVMGVVLIGAAWNFGFAVVRHQRESVPGLHPSAFYEGRVPGYEYLGVVNQHGDHSKWLLVGDARAFYFLVPNDYVVPFNHNPFFARIGAGQSALEIVEWLQENQYTNLVVHWTEVRRIAGTYGFHPPMNEERLNEVMTALAVHGVKRTHTFPHPLNPKLRYVELYEVESPMRSSP